MGASREPGGASQRVAYDTDLADEVRHALARADVVADERSMFGGVAFMVRGHMTVGVLGHDLIVRVGPDAYEEALTRPAARPMDLTGRPLTGLVFVDATVLGDAALERWVGAGLEFTTALPPK